MTAPLRPLLALGCAAAALTGCQDFTTFELDRMIEQARFRAYQETEFFPDKRVMRPPPEGTVPHDPPRGDNARMAGVVDGDYVRTVPLPLTRPLLERGRGRYEIYCATCHGLRGDGESSVSGNMELRKPPSLIDTVVRGFPPGRIFQVVSAGYGLMPSYDEQMSLDDRWAVVAYLQALQLSQGVRLDALPEGLKSEARKWLR